MQLNEPTAAQRMTRAEWEALPGDSRVRQNVGTAEAPLIERGQWVFVDKAEGPEMVYTDAEGNSEARREIVPVRFWRPVFLVDEPEVLRPAPAKIKRKSR